MSFCRQGFSRDDKAYCKAEIPLTLLLAQHLSIIAKVKFFKSISNDH